MHTISQQLSAWTDFHTGEPDGCSLAELTDLQHEAYELFWATEIGEELSARMDALGLDSREFIGTQFMPRFAERFGTNVPHPGAPFLERLVDVAKDLLIELPEPKPDPAPVAVRAPRAAAAATPAPEAPKGLDKVAQFAFMLNAHIREHGVPKVSGGFYYLVAGDQTKYEYPYKKFQELLEAASSRGLVHAYGDVPYYGERA